MPGRALPSTAPATPLSLDTLAARLVQPQRPTEAPWQPPRTPRPHLPPHVPGARPDTPTALVLPVTVATCAGCHSITRSPSHYALVRYSINSYTFRYSRADTASDNLPREIREHAVTVPFCEACFLPPAPSEASLGSPLNRAELAAIHDTGHGTYFPGPCPECAELIASRAGEAHLDTPASPASISAAAPAAPAEGGAHSSNTRTSPDTSSTVANRLDATTRTGGTEREEYDTSSIAPPSRRS